MKPIEQEDPTPNGDCLRCCVASILELDRNEVPDFCKVDGDWWIEIQNFLAEKGLFFLSIVLHRQTPWFSLPHHPWAIFIGKSKSGVTHAVVGKCRGDEFVVIHDPHPNKTGIDKVDNICFVVPINPATLKTKRILSSSIVPAAGRFNNNRR